MSRKFLIFLEFSQVQAVAIREHSTMSIRLEDQDVWDDSALMNSWNEALVEYTVKYFVDLFD